MPGIEEGDAETVGEEVAAAVGAKVGVGERIGVEVGDGDGLLEESEIAKDITLEWELNSPQYWSASCHT